MENKIFDIISRNYSSIENAAAYEKSVFDKILNCRKEPVPFLYTQCDTCGAVHPVYKSCKDRMCPICNGSAPIKWAAKRESELLAASYFLLTYTVPSQLRGLFLLNKRKCYDIFFKAMSHSLTEGIRNNDRAFHGKGGYFAMLHTCNQRLLYHPHLHVVVPAGCISNDGTEWRNSNPTYFLPVQRMSADFRKKFLFFLNKEIKAGSLKIPYDIDNPADYCGKLKYIPWVVHSQSPGKGMNKPEHIVRYLCRYVAKSIVNDSRIEKIENGMVYLKYYDRKKKQGRTEIITEKQFMNRLMLHILPKGFKKVRFYGFMANRYRAGNLALCRMLLGQPIAIQEEANKELLNDTAYLFWKYFGIDITLCKDCGKGHIQIVNSSINTS
jgi:hypothetical protein